VETGNRPLPKTAFSRDLSLDEHRVKACHAVINLRYDGFSVLYFSENKQTILGCLNLDWTPRKKVEELVQKVELELNKVSLHPKWAKSLHWLLSLEKFTLVPETYYLKGRGRQLLENTCRLTKGEHIYSDLWASQKAVQVFAIPNVLIDWIKTHFHGSTFSHSGTALSRLSRLYPKSETFALLHVEDFSAEFYVMQEGALKFYNVFPYEVEEDLLYLVLFALEQAGILAPEIELKLSGKALKGEKLYSLLQNYMGSLKSIPLPNLYNISPQIGMQEVRRVFKLLGGI
jgi:hypothetical protein